MEWFKFYGQDYLSDPKMLSLSAVERALWITILCLASGSEGEIKYITEEKIMTLTGIDRLDDEWKENEGFIKKFKALRLVTYRNKTVTVSRYADRQQQNLSNAERQKHYRERHKNEAKNRNVTKRYDSNARLYKNREDKNIKENYVKEKLSTEDGGVGKSLITQRRKALGI